MTGGVCPKCGTENPPGASFCGNCGFLLGSAPGGTTPAPPVFTPPAAESGQGLTPPPPAPEQPAEPDAQFPDGTEGHGVWTSVGQQPAQPQSSAWQPPPAYSAPPAPAKKPDNTLKIVLWVIGGCCGCIVLCAIAFIAIGYWASKNVPTDNSGTTDTSVPPLTDGGTGGADSQRLAQAQQLAGQVESATPEDIQSWAVEQGLGEYYNAQDAMVRACATGDAQVVRWLLDSGNAIPDEASPAYGSTGLQSASYNDQTECMALLLTHGADINLSVGPDQGTPLHQAALHDSINAAQLLIASGAELETRNGLGLTPLHDAANSNAAKVAALLLASGAPVDTPTDKEGNSALLLAAHQGNLEVAAVLVESGANVNFVDPQYGLTPLHAAAYKGSAEIVSLLLGAGANPYTRAKDGEKPYDAAMANGFTEVAEMLK